MLERADAAGVDELRRAGAGGVRGRAQRLEGGPLERAVDLDGREHEPRHAPAGQVGDHVGGGHGRLTPPALDRDGARAGVDRDHDPLAALVGKRLDQRRVGERRRAQDRAAAPAASTASTSVAWRSPPPACTGTLDRRADPLELLDVDRCPLAGAVEVHDVQRLRALVDPPPRRLARVGVERGLALVVALDEAHGPPAADVDRRVEDQL